METPFRASVVGYAFCACVSGCATPGATAFTAISPRNAADAIVIGKSTKPEVIAALGNTTVIRFDSGFEVWVYQVTGDTPATPRLGALLAPAAAEKGTPGKIEFVVLFAPSGVVTKTRIRPAPPPGKAKGS